MPRLKRPSATGCVLGLLCVMYLITYVDRVNIATAASSIRAELGLTNTQLGFVLSAFGYPYLLFQVFGGWIGDRFGPRRTLFLCGIVWAIARRGFAQGITHSFARLGNAVTPPIVAWLILAVSWRGSFIALGSLSLIWVLTWVWYFRDQPADHGGITSAELDAL